MAGKSRIKFFGKRKAEFLMKKILVIISITLLCDVKEVFASESKQFITIVNPVRISSYNPSAEESLKVQYGEISKNELTATWLLTYDALLRPGINDIVSSMTSDQEIGVFLEVTPRLAMDAGVVYNKSDSWHRPNSLFTSGYKQHERLKLIDQLFNEFFRKYKYYPKSVGAWWIDSYSLEYMQKKYDVIANLGVTDQYSTDGYQIWGQYWSVPFYPSKNHSAMPAQNINNKIDVVTIQWAPRDPLNGYGLGDSSLYSIQDYLTIGLKDDYLISLIDLYSTSNNNKFGQVTFGLESDLPAEGYKGAYARQIKLIKQYEQSRDIGVKSMKEFAYWYKNNFPNLSPDHLIQSNDLLGKPLQAIWYQNTQYRIGLVYDKTDKSLSVVDFRSFHDNFQEPYYLSPNNQIKLSINIPSILDIVSDKNTNWNLQNLNLMSINRLAEGAELVFENDKKIVFKNDQLEIINIDYSIPSFVEKSPVLKIKNAKDMTNIYVLKDWIFDEKGLILNDLSVDATYFLKRKKVQMLILLISIFIATTTFVIKKSKLNKRLKKVVLSCVVLGVLSTTAYLIKIHSQKYFVSQGELDALIHLSVLPLGKVLVYDQGCLICTYNTQYPPAVFGNKRNYVKEISKKPIIYNRPVFITESRVEGKKILDSLKAKYVYLVKFETYEEKMPFSPGDYKVEKIFENANAEIWEVGK